MKQNMMLQTGNVKRALQYIKLLQSRPVTEIVGLMLIYGKPGLGKTRFAERFVYTNGYIYIRLEAPTTAKDLLFMILDALYVRMGINKQIHRGTATKLLQEIKFILNSEEMSDTVIIIDEIDYSFGNKKMLGSIRDIVDETIAVIIMVGMQNAYHELKKTNEHMFDRCNFILEFKHNSKEDTNLICKNIADFDISEEQIETINKSAKGNLRKAMKALDFMEKKERTS